MKITAAEAFEAPTKIPQELLAPGTGIGRMSAAQETWQRGRTLEAYAKRARKGRGGTHLGKKKKGTNA